MKSTATVALALSLASGAIAGQDDTVRPLVK
jgi:hypothetical protein